QPVNSQELFAIERMAMAQQSMLRAARFEAGFLTLCVIDTLTADNQPAYFTPEELRDDLRAVGVQNANLCLADGLNRMAKTSKGFSLSLRFKLRRSASTAAHWRNSSVSKAIGQSYQTNPFQTTNLNKTLHLPRRKRTRPNHPPRRSMTPNP